jgi:uridine phosphorylase
MSQYGLGLDNMLRSYLVAEISEIEMEDAFIQQTNWDLRKGRPYVIAGSKTLEKRLESDTIFKGFTGTAGGFYGPQGRVIRLGIQDPELNSKMDRFNYNGIKMTNLEMETAAIYGLGRLLGHNCLSLNAIIANRATGTFSEDPYKAVDELIIYTLNKLVE